MPRLPRQPRSNARRWATCTGALAEYQSASTGARGLTALLGLGAGAAYFAVNTGLLAVARALEKNESAWRAWREPVTRWRPRAGRRARS